MAEAVANLAGHDEQQNFSSQDSDQPHLADHGVDQQNMSAEVPEVYNFVGDVSEDQTFIENEPEDSYVAVMEQHYSENDTEQPLNGVQHDQALTGDDSKQEFSETVTTETENTADNSHSQKKDEHENKRAGGGEKKWPGWPGDSVFRMLVPAQKVGNIIGRKGEYIKKLVEETKARIKVINGPPGSQERAVMVSAKEDPDSSLPPAIDGLLKVHKRITDGLDGDTSQVLPAGGKVSTKLLVPATQAGILIGKQGSTIKSIQETSSCIVRVLGPEDLPVFALQEDRVVEVAGDPANVHSAVELIASHLRKFLVDRSIIPVFEKQMQAPSGPMEHMPPQPWGPPHGLPMSAGGGHGYGPNSQYMPPPRQYDNYYPPADMPPPSDRHSHQPISSHGREPAMGVHASSNMQPTQSMVTQVTQHMQIPLLYADAVIGANGSTISYIRRASGAAVTVQESRGAPGDMTVEINGTSSQVQAAQQLIQNFMAEAAAQTGGSTEQAYSSQGYNSYAPPTSMYGSPPSATGHANQASGGAYGYGGGYGY